MTGDALVTCVVFIALDVFVFVLVCVFCRFVEICWANKTNEQTNGEWVEKLNVKCRRLLL